MTKLVAQCYDKSAFIVEQRYKSERDIVFKFGPLESPLSSFFARNFWLGAIVPRKKIRYSVSGVCPVFLYENHQTRYHIGKYDIKTLIDPNTCMTTVMPNCVTAKAQHVFQDPWDQLNTLYPSQPIQKVGNQTLREYLRQQLSSLEETYK